MTQILTAPNLCEIPSIRHAFFTKGWGNAGFSGQEDAADAHTARAAMANHLGVAPQNLLTAYQIHSPDVVVVDTVWDADNRPRADALVTNKRGIALGVLTADCVPVLFAGDGVIGAAHAGWRGALAGVIENTVAAMERLGARRGDIHAALGPCIWQDSYEVGAEFPAPFLAENPDNQKFFKPALKSGHYLFDLPAYVGARLQAVGVASVAPSPADTCADPARFFSHRYATLRHEKRGGNLMAAITMKGNPTC